VQLLVETGAVGFIIALWFLVALSRSALRKLNHFQSAANAAVTLAALLGVSGILVHSFVDFNLQIPANAAMFYVLCVAAAMKPCASRNHSPHDFSVTRKSARIFPGPDFEVI
jgi:O-antigen ligase